MIGALSGISKHIRAQRIIRNYEETRKRPLSRYLCIRKEQPSAFWALRMASPHPAGSPYRGTISAALVCIPFMQRVKPQLDECRELAYDKLAQMSGRISPCSLIRSFTTRRQRKQVGLINAGHFAVKCGYFPHQHEYPECHITGGGQAALKPQAWERIRCHLPRGTGLLGSTTGRMTQGEAPSQRKVIKNTYLTQEQTFTRKIVKSSWPLRLKNTSRYR